MTEIKITLFIEAKCKIFEILFGFYYFISCNDPFRFEDVLKGLLGLSFKHVNLKDAGCL